jgi:hypothetical protein
MGTRIRLMGVLLVVTVMLVAVTPAFAQDIVLPTGLACRDFGLGITISGGDSGSEHRVLKEFEDKHGNVVRVLDAGKGFALTFENLSTSATVSLKPNGSVAHTTINPDGTMTVVTTGHNVVILFPTDVPAGPSTILYVGRLVYTVDTAGVFTVQSFSGRTSDICAQLSS